MIDIVEITTDMGFANTNVTKAANVLSVQLGSLEYAQDFGVDLAYFLDENFTFQNSAFKSYLIQRLAESGIDVASLTEIVETLYSNYIFGISPTDEGGGLIR